MVRTHTMSNTERQREFRLRNPGYYQRLHAKSRARTKLAYEQYLTERVAAAQAAKLAASTPWPTGDAAVSVLFDAHSV